MEHTVSMADAAAKAQVARDVCAAAAAFAACQHRRPSPRRPQFIDHYLVLHIDEAASEDDINRRFRHLALQLHPDKNGDSNAEAAFRLVSEAKACLTDKARRRAFDAERSRAVCAACHAHARLATTSHRASTDKKTTSPAPSAQQNQQAHGGVSGRRAPAPAPRPTPTPTLLEVQNRLKEELRIIDDCLRGQGDVARRRRQSDSYPVFEPSDETRFPAYPRARPPFAGSRPFEEEIPVRMGQDRSSRRGGGGCRETPVYQVRTEP